MPALDVAAALADIERRTTNSPSRRRRSPASSTPSRLIGCSRARPPEACYNSGDGLARFPDPHRRRHRAGRHARVLRRAAARAARRAPRRSRHAAPASSASTPFTFVTPSGEWTLAARRRPASSLRDGDDGAASRAAHRRRRRRRRQRPQDADDVPHRRHGSTCRAATSATSSTGGSCCARSSTRAPVHTRGAIDFHDRDGAPLDLHRSFGPDDDDADIAHFLAEAGFLHLRGWFDPDAMAEISADMDGALPDLHARRRPVVVGDDGRRRRPLRAHAVRSTSTPRRTRRSARRRDRYRRIGRLTDDDYALRERRQPHRGAREADRCRRRHLRRAVAQGLLARHALLPVLRPHDRHLGHRRRRAARASCASSPVRTARSCSPRSCGPSRTSRSSTCRRRPATSPSTARARCTCRSRRSSASGAVMYTGFGLAEVARAERATRTRALADIGQVREGAYTTVSQAPGYTAPLAALVSDAHAASSSRPSSRVDPLGHGYTFFAFLARLGATRGGSPGIFGYTGGHGASVRPAARSRS